MVFQWYLFVLLIFVAIFATVTGQRYLVDSYGQKEIRYTWLPALIILFPLVYLAATRTNSFGDTSAYRSMFANYPSTLAELPNVLASNVKDDGFVIFSVFVKSIIGNRVELFFGIIAFICLYLTIKTFRRYSCNFIMTMFLFIASGDYVQWTHNGMRQFIAVAMVFGATKLLLDKKYLYYFLIVLLAYTIHASVLIMIPISIVVQGKAWNFKTVIFLLGVLLAISFAEEFTTLIVDLMGSTQYSGEIDQFLGTEGTNMLRVLVFSIPTLMSLFFRRQINQSNNKLIELSSNMSIASMGAYIVSAYTSGIFVGRMPIYFSLYNYILLPWLVETFFEKRSAYLIYSAVIICYLVFYYYQIVVTWGL